MWEDAEADGKWHNYENSLGHRHVIVVIMMLFTSHTNTSHYCFYLSTWGRQRGGGEGGGGVWGHTEIYRVIQSVHQHKLCLRRWTKERTEGKVTLFKNEWASSLLGGTYGEERGRAWGRNVGETRTEHTLVFAVGILTWAVQQTGRSSESDSVLF